VQFLVNEKGFKYVLRHFFIFLLNITGFFSEERVRKGADRLQKFLNAKQQGRLDGFFTTKPKEKPPLKGKAEKSKSGPKRKVNISSNGK
jgi:flap endonuclease-1